MSPLRIVYFGSDSFGLPTLRALVERPERYEVGLVVTQPDRPAGRKRTLQATDVGRFAEERGLAVLKSPDVNAPAPLEQVRAVGADAFVVIAFGQKLGEAILDGTFAINLHASLLPRWRGAAPIARAIMANDLVTGVTVITLAPRMDAGLMLAKASTPIDPMETAGELHDRLALLGPGVVSAVLEQYQAGDLKPEPQDESLATRARKLRKEEGTTEFAEPADLIRARIHGLNPWPGCTVVLDGRAIKIGRVRAHQDECAGTPGAILPDGRVACASGAVEVLEIQTPGGRMMPFEDFRRGHEWPVGGRLAPAY